MFCIILVKFQVLKHGGVAQNVHETHIPVGPQMVSIAVSLGFDD